jgi:DNA polymerase-3 subunit delta
MKATEPRLKAALDRPPADIRLYLLHGPDDATATGLAARLARALGEGAERIDLEPGTLRSDPARLTDEAAAIALFGGARWVRVTGAGEESLDAVEALLSAAQAGNPAVLIAPGVKATGKLVKAAIDSDRAMAFACYPPNDRDFSQLANDLAREQGLRLTGNVAQRLMRAAEGDRAVLAREIEKLALYLDAAPDHPAEADEAAVEAIGATLSEGEIGAIVAAVTAGEPAAVVDALRRLDGPDASPIPVLRALARRFVMLAEMRQQVERGEGVDQVMKRHRVFWKEEAATAAALRRWKAADLTRALARVREGERAVIAAGAAGRTLASTLLVGLARRAGG